jgi:hypothetical protein
MLFRNFTSNDLTSFNNYLIEMLSNKKQKNVFIFGDFNIYLLKLETQKPTADYLDDSHHWIFYTL